MARHIGTSKRKLLPRAGSVDSEESIVRTGGLSKLLSAVKLLFLYFLAFLLVVCSLSPSLCGGGKIFLDYSYGIMRFLLSTAAAASCLLFSALATRIPARVGARATSGMIKPKVMIISMFDPEAEVWYGIPEFDVLAVNVTVPGASPLFPDVHCTSDGDVCQYTIGESGMCR